LDSDKQEALGFPRQVRLTCPKAFQRVFEHGKRLNVVGLSVRVATNGEGRPRLGMAIAKRSLRYAHDRNRVRRLVRESFRLHQTALPSVDIVIMSRSDVLQMANLEVFQQLEYLWGRLCKLYPTGGSDTRENALPLP